jgi:hypothetical protein
MIQVQQAESRESVSTNKVYLLLLIGITAVYCVWVLSLPLFPTSDGPMHLYYVHVLRELLGKGPSAYEHYYFIKHLLPPYSLYYYSQMVLSMAVPDLMAEKIIVCTYFILFVFGFRYLATAVGPGGQLMSLLAPLLLLNWPLGMGFVNFCIAVSLAMWAIGLWWRVSGTANFSRKLLFLLLVYLTMLTHPVPLLFILGFGFAELGVRLMRHLRLREKVQALPNFSIQDAVFLCVAAGTLLYVKLFTVSTILRQAETPKVTIHTFANNAWAYVFQYSLDVFRGEEISVTLYRIALFLVLIIPLGLALKARVGSIRSGEWTTGDLWLCLSIMMILGLPFVPLELNHSYYFAYRLVLVVWLAGIAAGSLHRDDSRTFAAVVIGFSLAGNVLILSLAHARINPVADNIALAARASAGGVVAADEGQAGVLLNEYQKPRTLNYDPYMWAGANYFRANGAIVYNSPWLNLPIIPLGAEATMPYGRLDDMALEQPVFLRDEMNDSAASRDLVLSDVAFVFVNRNGGSNTKVIDAILAADSANQWNCERREWFEICRKQQR